LKMKKQKIISMLLVIVCLVGLLAVPAFAEGSAGESVTEASPAAEANSAGESSISVIGESAGEEKKTESTETEKESGSGDKSEVRNAAGDKSESGNDSGASSGNTETDQEDEETALATENTLFLAAAASVEIRQVHAKSYGKIMRYVSAYRESHAEISPVSTYAHYDVNTNNAVYCANINRHFVSGTIYEVAGQWRSDAMCSALAYTFENGVKKANGLAASKYSTGDSGRDWYATQMVVWAILHDYGIKDAKGQDAGIDMATTQPVSGYENVFNMMRNLYNDAKYFASKQSDGSTADPYYVMENPEYKQASKTITDKPVSITSAEEPGYALDVRGGSASDEATVQLYRKNYSGAQQWIFEKSGEEGYYFLKNKNSGKYLETDGSTNGSDIQQNSKDGSDKQKWKLIAEADGSVQLAPKTAPDKRVDVKNGVFVNGTNIQLYQANNSKAQKFHCEPADFEVKNISEDGSYLQSDWIDVSSRGDLVSREFTLEGAPEGSSIVYQKNGDLLSSIAVRVPIASVPVDGQYHFKVKVSAVFNKSVISYLAINDSDAQEILVAGNPVHTTVTDQLSVYTVPVYGGLKISKRDADTADTIPQGDASLANAEFEIVNKSGYAVQVNGKKYADGAVVKTLKTDEKGYAATGEKELQAGKYLVREKTAPVGYLGKGVTAKTVEITGKTAGTLVDMTGPDNSIKNLVIRGGVKIKKQDADYQDDNSQGDASLKDAEFTITNKSKGTVVVGGKKYKPDEDVLTIRTDEKGVAASSANALPYGSYEIRETKAGEGYLLNEKWKQSFEIRENGEIVDLTKEPCDETIVRGGVKIKKQDVDYKNDDPQGDASLKNAEFTITNKSKGTVVVGGKKYKFGEDVLTIRTDEKGVAASAADVLPYGSYEIRETKAGEGYLLNEKWKPTFEIRENGKIVDLTKEPCDETIIRGGVKIKKQDVDYQDNDSQGDASLKDAEFTITNKSKGTVAVGGKKYKPGEDVLTICTDENGVAASAADALPYGSYEIRETKAGEGYLLNEKWKQSFEIRENGKIVDLTKEPCDETIIRGGVEIEKRDRELDKNEALGGANLSGIEFTIRNASAHRVLVDGKSYDPEEVITTLVTDEEGHASLPEDSLPYGTYSIQETKTNDSYLLTDGEARTFQIRKDQETVKADVSGNELVFRNQTVRNDFHFNKIADKSNARMGRTVFVVTQLETGEQHVIVTDQNGVFNSKSKVNPHSQNTNGNDFVLKKYAGENDVIPSDELDYKAGCWFGLGQKGSEAPVQDGLGALPYGSYRMQELRCEANAGYKLLDIRFYVESDQSVEPIIDLGTLTDEEEEKPEIHTEAIAKDTGTHQTQPSKSTVIIDTVTYKNLKPGTEYTMHGMVMVPSEDGKSAEELLIDGKKVTAEEKFTPEKSDGEVQMTFTFDSTSLAGSKVVVFEEARQGSLVVAEHLDAGDTSQTIAFEKPETTSTPTPETPETPETSETPSTPSTPSVTSSGSSYRAAPVKTGDNSRTGMYLVLIALAGTAAIVIYRARKKH
jgi:hypothetical protein